MTRTKMTDEALRLFTEEAKRRAEAKTNKQLAQLTGLTPMYVANVVAKLRRGICQRVDVSTSAVPRGTQEVGDTRCSKCGGAVEAGRKHRYCRACFSEYQREHRPKYSELSDTQRGKSIARSMANVAVRRGQLVRQSCEKCGNSLAEKHHDNYDEPLKIRWLCKSCHIADHGSAF